MINSGYILKGEHLGLSDEVDVGKERTKELPPCFGLTQSRRMQLPFTELCGD